MANKLINQPSQKGNNTEQEYYNLYYSENDNCVFTPASKATASALTADIVYRIVTNQLTNDVQFTTTKAHKVKGKTYTNFNVKVMPTDGEFKDKYVSAGFINFYENELTESSSQKDKDTVITNLRKELEVLKPAQVSKHITTEGAKAIVASL